MIILKPAHLVILSLGMMIISCSDHPYQSELDEIEDLELILDSARNSYSSIDLEEIVIVKSNIEADRNSLINYVNDNADSASTQIGTLIDDLRIALKYLKKLEGNRSQIEEQILYSTDQLSNLEHDLKNNVLRANDVDSYMKDERVAIKSLKKAIDEVKHYSSLGVLKYERNKTMIDSLKQLAR